MLFKSKQKRTVGLHDSEAREVEIEAQTMTDVKAKINFILK